MFHPVSDDKGAESASRTGTAAVVNGNKKAREREREKHVLFGEESLLIRGEEMVDMGGRYACKS